jgi:hypothetical protein
MLEGGHCKTVWSVAKVTPLDPERSLMGIVNRMADPAGVGIIEPKTQGPVFTLSRLVTGGARGHQVGAFQLEAHLHLVLGSIVVRRYEAVGTVASITALLAENTVVGIQVAGGAGVVGRHWIGLSPGAYRESQGQAGGRSPSRRVTSTTVHPCVGAREVEPCVAMLEAGLHASRVQPVPAIRCVTRSAEATHASRVGVLMTGGTVGSVHGSVSNQHIASGEPLRNMTPLAIDRPMLSLQGVGRLGVVEGPGVHPLLLGMAIPAGAGSELIPVGILLRVAGATPRVQTEVGPRQPTAPGQLPPEG